MVEVEGGLGRVEIRIAFRFNDGVERIWDDGLMDCWAGGLVGWW